MHGDAGIDHGQSLQLQGEGGPAAAKEGTPGNLFVQVSVAPDSVLTRRGTNIHVTLDIDFADAILGRDAKYVQLLSSCLTHSCLIDVMLHACLCASRYGCHAQEVLVTWW